MSTGNQAEDSVLKRTLPSAFLFQMANLPFSSPYTVKHDKLIPQFIKIIKFIICILHFKTGPGLIVILSPFEK